MSAQAIKTGVQRGLFIVVEGLDRAGKSTQVARLAKILDAQAIKFPDRTTAIGQMIDSYLASRSELDDRAIHLLFSANRWECARSIQKMIDGGKNVVCDRYAFSGIAYTVAKGLPYDWALSPDRGLPAPDLTIFLDLDPRQAAGRADYGSERYERVELQERVREAFRRVALDVRNGDGSGDVEAARQRWVTVDASGSLEAVGKQVDAAAQGLLADNGGLRAALHGLFTTAPPNANP